MNQLEENLNSENKKYGNNGKFVEVWMAQKAKDKKLKTIGFNNGLI